MLARPAAATSLPGTGGITSGPWLVLASAWLAVCIALVVLHAHLHEAGWQRTRTLADVAAAQLGASVTATDAWMKVATDELLRAGLGRPSGPATVFDSLRKMQAAHPEWALLTLVGEDGRLLGWSRSPFASLVTLVGRDYITAHAGKRARHLYVGRITRSEFFDDVSGSLLVYSMQMPAPDGEAMPVLVAYASEQPLRGVLQALLPPAGGSVRLLREDGTLLLSEPEPEPEPERNGTLPARIDLGALRPEPSVSQSYRGQLPGDDEAQFYSLTRVPAQGLLAVAGVSQWQQMALMRPMAGWGGLLLLIVTAVMGRHIWRLNHDCQSMQGLRQQLEETETKLSGLLQSVPDALWSSNGDRGRLRYFSPAAARLFDLPVSRFAAQPDAWLQTVVDQDRAAVTRHYLDTRFTEGQRFEHTYRIQAGDTVRWISHRAWGAMADSGLLVSIDHLASDVTSQQTSLLALREREQELQALLEGFPVGALFFKDGRCYANPAARQLLGDACHDRLRPVDLLVLLHLAPDGSNSEPAAEWRVCALLRPGRPAVFMRVGWRLVAGGHLWLLHDVSDSERQTRLSGEEETAAGIGGWELDLRSGQVLWSPQMYRLHELSPQSFAPDRSNVAAFYTAESQQRLRAAMQQAILDGTSFSLDLDLLLPSGTARKVHVLGRAQSHEGRVIRLYGSLQDISERVKTLQALERQTQILHAAEQIASMGSWEWRPGEDAILWSHGAQVMHCLVDGVMPQGMQGWLSRVHPADREAMAGQLHRLETSATPLEWVYRAFDSRLLWRHIAVKTLPELDGAGRVQLVRGTLHDITETRSLNEALALRNRAIESLSSGVLITDLELPGEPIIYASPAASDITGYRNEELLNRNCRYLQGDDQAQPEIAVIRHAIDQRQPVQVTLRNYRKDGSMFWNELALAPVPDEQGHIRYYIGIVTDVTARRRSEVMLLEMQQRLRSILDTAADAIVVVDERGAVQLFSHAAESIFGYRADEVVGRSVAMLLPAGVADPHEDFLQRYLTDGRGHPAGPGRQLTGLRKDGSEVPIELAVSDWKAGGEQFFTGVIRDVSEQRELQRQLLQSQKLDALGQLAGGVAHDFNNLLGVVVGNLDMLAALLDKQPALLKRVNTALAAAERGASLTKRLLSFARSTPAQAERMQVVDLNQAVLDIADLLRQPVDSGIELQLDLAREALPVRLDAAELQNALLNLVFNARDAMPQGGRLLVATRASHEREARPDLPAGDYVEVSVSDTGSGIPESVRERIFDPFFTTKPKGKGTGLGLPLVYSYLKRMQGAVRLESTVGAGSTFRLVFPRAKGQVDPVQIRPAAHSGAGQLILVVDDERALLDTVADQLESLGYTTLRFDDPVAAAVEIERRDDLAMLFTDILMPRMTGTELATLARRRHPGLPVLLYTGYPDRYLDDVLLRQPGVVLLSKPVARGRLVGALQQLLPAAGTA